MYNIDRNTSFEKNCFSAQASTLNGFDQQRLICMFVACGIWCLADVSEQTFDCTFLLVHIDLFRSFFLLTLFFLSLCFVSGISLI